MAINWFDNFADKMGDYTKYLSNRHINAVAPRIKVYLLNRENGPSDTLYNEELNRVYLPYFTLRGMYVVQRWTQTLGLNSVEEPDTDNTTIIFNFDNMVISMRQLKQLHKFDLNVTYLGSGHCSFRKENGYLYIEENHCPTYSINLANYTIQELSTYLDGLANYSCTYTPSTSQGSESSLNLVDFTQTEIAQNETINIYSYDLTFQGIEEIIKVGDLIITHQNVLYEVVNAYVTNLRYFTWPTYLIKCEKRKLSDYTKLPDNGIDVLLHQDNFLLQKYRNENSESY